MPPGIAPHRSEFRAIHSKIIVLSASREFDASARTKIGRYSGISRSRAHRPGHRRRQVASDTRLAGNRPWSIDRRSGNLIAVRHPVAIQWARQPLLAALLLVTFLSRALIPTGFMPGHDGLILCHGMDTTPSGTLPDMSMDMSGMAHDANHASRHGSSSGHEGGSVCPFAAAVTAMASGQAIAPLASAIGDGNVLPVPDSQVVPSGTIVPTRLPRGPPQIA